MKRLNRVSAKESNEADVQRLVPMRNGTLLGHLLHGKNLATAILCSILISCSGGINPADYSQRASINGSLHFVRGAGRANYPVDSLYDLRVVAFRTQPKDTNLINEIGNGTAIFTPTLVDSLFSYPAEISYSLEVPQNQLSNGSIEFRYIAVAQRYGPNILSDWRVIGLYSSDTLYTPAILRIQSGVDHQHVDMDVDALKPPPQPFKR